MAKKHTTKRAKAKTKPSKPTKAPEPKGGGGSDGSKAESAGMDSSAEKKSALDRDAFMSSRIDSWERQKLLNELLDSIARHQRIRFELTRGGMPDCLRIEQTVESLREAVAERDAKLARLHKHLYRALSSPTLPDTRDGIADMLRRAPTAWHIRTVVEGAIDFLVHTLRREERASAALRCLGEITRLFQSGLKLRAKRSRQLREALEHPAFLDALNCPPPKRTRGGTGGNHSRQAVFTWTEMSIIEFDKRYNRDMLPSIYADIDSYIERFLRYAKEQWESEGWEYAEALTDMKIRINSTDPDKPKQSFGLFKKEIEKNARQFVAGWLDRYAPNVRDKCRSGREA